MFYYSGNLFASHYVKSSIGYKHIICDRYFYSTLVYYSFYNNCTITEALEMMGKINEKLLCPDLVFYLTITEDIWIERLNNRGKKSTKKEKH